MTVDKLLAALTDHKGRYSGICATRLAALIDCPERRVRQLITEAREAGHPVCGTPRDGYYLAANSEELEETVEFLKGRALCSLSIASKLTRKSLPELVGQLQLTVNATQEKTACPA